MHSKPIGASRDDAELLPLVEEILARRAELARSLEFA